MWLIDDASRDPRCLEIAENSARAIISVLDTFVLHPVRWYAILESTDAKWGTRSQVEVSIQHTAPREESRPGGDRPPRRPPAVREPVALVRSGA